ncbi:MAG: zinc ribbon domain-containing protein [Anaerolineaceae bacterium]
MSEQLALKCKGCGAQLDSNVRKGKIICPYCGTINIFKLQVETAGMLICPNCGFANHLEAEYCEDCGQSLYMICPKCGTHNKADAAHCIKCGLRLGEEINLQNLYSDYLSEAKRIKKIFRHRFNPWFLSLIPTLFAIIMNLSFPDDFGVVLGTTLVFSIPAMILLPVGKNLAKKKTKKEVEKINSTKVGFSEFYNLYFAKHYWPEVMVNNEKRERFLSIVKMK